MIVISPPEGVSKTQDDRFP